ncbi:MAG: hypothetical protein CM15mP45_11700 [Deltaproteobacteria bacterium]|nr:MAG: hypothetical protein CM15mP45_11700 [Deltaproteobacteria bacterium]
MSTANPYTELTQQTREDLVLEHAPQIKRIVTRMAARFPPGVDQEELYQAGMMGLLDALEKFDASKEVQFKTYANSGSKERSSMNSVKWIGSLGLSVLQVMNGKVPGVKKLRNWDGSPPIRKWLRRWTFLSVNIINF